jgi:thioredoxin-related protein
MKKIIIIMIMFFILQIVVQGDEIAWYENITKAFDAAKKQKRYMMIDIYTDWCTWCKELDKRTYTHEAVIRLSKKIINVKINPEKDTAGKDFIKGFPIDGYPTIIFVDWEKNLIGKIGGFLDGENFAKQAEKIIAFPEKAAKLKEEHAQGKIKSTEELIGLLIDLKKEDEALALIEELRLSNRLPFKIEYFFTIGMTHISREYYNTALVFFNLILKSFNPGDDLINNDYFYKSAYYAGLCLSSLGRTGELKTLVEKYKKDINNPYTKYLDALLEN